MKKALIALLAVALVGAVAFAEDAAPTSKVTVAANFGFGFKSDSSTTTLENYDYSRVGGTRVRLGYTYTAADGNAGFNSRLQMTDYASGVNATFNRLNAWGKFADGLVTVRAGILDDYTIATTYGNWNGYGNTDGKTGIYVNLTPVEGLDVGYFKNSAVSGSSNLFEGDILGASYKIADVADFQVGWQNVVRDTTNGIPAYNTIYFGTDVKAVKDLSLWLEGNVTDKTNKAVNVNEYVGYTLDKLTIGSYAGQSFTDSKTNWGFEPAVDYKLTDELAINVLANIYTVYAGDDGSATGLAYMSAIDAGKISAGTIGDTAFGIGGSVAYTKGGATIRLGDYYGAAAKQNIVYANYDLSL